MAKQPNRKPSKVYDVPIGKMRVPPALVTQREFRKAHGDRIAADLDLNKIGLPVLNHRDGMFWVHPRPFDAGWSISASPADHVAPVIK